MTGNPWDKFFWNDWESDPALRLCSMAAQGLWMRCLCIAAKAEPRGFLTVNGIPLDANGLARLTGEPESSVETWLSELDRNGVFSRDRKGRIYSRRMVRDHKKAQTARKNGKLGGNPKLCNKRKNKPSVNVGDKARDKTHKPEARSQSIDDPNGSLSFDLPEKTPDEVALAVQAYNDLAKRCGLPTASKLTTKRKAAIRNRLKDAGGLDGWNAALGCIEATPGLRGENNRGWRANLDFLCQESSFLKLMEGHYDNWRNDDNDPPPTGPAGKSSGHPARQSSGDTLRAAMAAEAVRRGGGSLQRPSDPWQTGAEPAHAFSSGIHASTNPNGHHAGAAGGYPADRDGSVARIPDGQDVGRGSIIEGQSVRDSSGGSAGVGREAGSGVMAEGAKRHGQGELRVPAVATTTERTGGKPPDGDQDSQLSAEPATDG